MKYIENIVDQGNMVHTSIWGKGDMKPIVKLADDFIVNEASVDTIYKLDYSGRIEPLIARIPSINSMAVPVFLWVDYASDRYYFMTARKRDPEAESPYKDLFYDSKDKSVYEGAVRNQDGYLDDVDFVEKKNGKTTIYCSMGALRLITRLENDRLSGELKEIAGKLKEDDNPVLMVATFKE